MLTVDDYARIRRAYRDGMSLRGHRPDLSPYPRTIREALENPSPSPIPGPGRRPPPSSIPSRPRSTRSSRPTSRPRASSGTPRPRSIAGSSPSTAIRAATTRSDATSARSDAASTRDVHPPGPRSRPPGRGRLRPHLRGFPRRSPARPGPDRHLGVLVSRLRHRPAHRAHRGHLHGLVEAFTSFGCVPKELWWDNPTTVAGRCSRGASGALNERYKALASHYNFEPLFCMPARGNEKPHVENRVRTWNGDGPRRCLASGTSPS